MATPYAENQVKGRKKGSRVADEQPNSKNHGAFGLPPRNKGGFTKGTKQFLEK